MISRSYFYAVASSNAMFDYSVRYKMTENHVVVKERTPVNSDVVDSVAALDGDERRCVATLCSEVRGSCARYSSVVGEMFIDESLRVVRECLDGMSAACEDGYDIASANKVESLTYGEYNAENVSVVSVVVSVRGADVDDACVGSSVPVLSEYCTELRGWVRGTCPANDLKVMNIDVALKVSMVPVFGSASTSSGGYDKGIESVDTVLDAVVLVCAVARPGEVGECTV